MYDIDYMKQNKSKLTKEELDNFLYFGMRSEDDYRFFADVLDWDKALEMHSFSEEFLRENIKYMNIKSVFLYQEVSDDFKREFNFEKYFNEEEMEEYNAFSKNRKLNRVLSQIEQLGRMFGYC